MQCVDVLSVTVVTDNPVTVHGVDEGNMVTTTNSQVDYETVDSLDTDLVMQYLSGRTQLLAEYCEDLVLKMGISREKAVEFGCGTGLVTFLLTKTFKEVLHDSCCCCYCWCCCCCVYKYIVYIVCTHSIIKGTHVQMFRPSSLPQVVGVEYSGIFVDAAMKIQEGTTVTTSEGKEISLNSYIGVNPKRAVFKQVLVHTHALHTVYTNHMHTFKQVNILVHTAHSYIHISFYTSG